MDASERKERDRKNAEWLAKINAQRVADKVCRHCGGRVPCWSPFGDVRVGVRHSRSRLMRKQAYFGAA